MRKRVFGVGLIVSALIALACGSGSSTKPSGSGKSAAPTQVATVAVGQPLTLSSSLLGQNSEAVITVQSVTPQAQGQDAYSKPVGQYLVAAVAIDCTTGTYQANPLNFAFVAADGTRIQATYTPFDPMLTSVALQAGQKTAGNVVFDVPVGPVTGAKIAIRGTLGNKDLGYWQL